jgi:hypothetical protein
MQRTVILLLLLLPVLLAAAFTDIGADFEDYRESPATAGIGGCGLAAGLDPAAWGYNPAVGLDAGSGILFKHTEAFGGEARVTNDLLAASYRTGFGGVGFTALRNGAGNIHFTSLPDTTRPPDADNRPQIDSTVTASDWAGQVSVAFVLANLWLGANVKIFYRDLVAATGFGLGADIGVRYRFDWGLSLAARVKNVSTSPIFWSTDSTDILIPRSAIGGMQEFGLGRQTLRLIAESEVSLMGIDSLEAHLGPLYLRPRGGLELIIYDIIALRVGRADYGWSVGAGGRYKGFFIDYAYRGHDGGLGATHLVGAGYMF